MRSRRQQGRRSCAEQAVKGFQTECRLLAGPAHELTRAEIGDRLGQAALEFVALHLPLNILQTCLEREGHRRQAGEHTEQG